MGILNITPDSFYDRGRYWTREAAIVRGHQMVDEGADIIDVGGEKAGPGISVSAEDEIERVVPIIETLRREVPVPLSVDTFKPEVARAAIGAGVDFVNSIGGFDDPEMREAAANSNVVAVIMHIRGLPRVANPNPHYVDVVSEVRQSLADRVAACLNSGIAAERIVIDPGPGFGKLPEHDLTLLRNLDALTSGPYPVLLAASRKGFIGAALGIGVDERLEGSLAVVAWGVLMGVKIVRVHDVRASKRVTLMTEAVLHPEFFGGQRA